MKKIVLTFGCLSGAVMVAMMWATLPFIERIGFDRGAIVGYTSIVLSFLFIFFGVRAYREHLGESPLTFGGAFTAGILITLISCAFYVASWEIMYTNFMPDFVDQYAAYTMDKLRAQGATQATLDANAQSMADFKTMYASVPMRVAMSFIEPFPVGLIMTLIAAVTLRTKTAKS